MEPPPKRLRILQSFDVDEDDPEYIKAKQKQQQRFKGSLEGIFEKYGNMHESMSDEIDMRTNKIVVDRGHLRRVVRQVNRRETMLLDTLGLGPDRPGMDDEEDSQDEEQEESEDELAPTQIPKSSPVLKRKQSQSNSGQLKSTSDPASTFAPPQNVAMTPSHNAIQPLNSMDPASSLLQLVPFPQTPAGQQAQSTFYATLVQTINQAVQQAVTPLMQNVFSNTPGIQLPFPQPQHTPATPQIPPTTDKVAPPSDPKWFFPPLPSKLREVEATPSVSRNPRAASKVSTPAAPSSRTPVARKPNRAAKGKAVETAKTATKDAPSTITETEAPQDLPESQVVEAEECEPVTNRRSSPQVIIRKRRDMSRPSGPTKRRAIRTISKNEQEVPTTPSDAVTSHLPTPSWSEYEDMHKESEQLFTEEEERIIPPSSSHYDTDECDLLSIAEDNANEHSRNHSPVEILEEQHFCPDPDDDILPSVEDEDFLHEDSLQQTLLENSTPQPTIKSEPPHSAPRPKRDMIHQPLCLDFPSTIPETQIDACESIFSSSFPQYTNNHSSQPHPQPHPAAPTTAAATATAAPPLPPQSPRSPRPSSINLPYAEDTEEEEDDELTLLPSSNPQQQPVTPAIKREYSSPPPPSSLLFSTPRTNQKSAEKRSEDTGCRSLSKAEQLKRVRKSWARKGGRTPGSGSGSGVKSGARRSLGSAKKGVGLWSGKNARDEESEDELGM